MKKLLSSAFDLLLITLLATGLFFRFYRTDWSQGADLHPDEYGLTGTLTQLSLPDNLSDYFNTRLSTLSPYQKYDAQGNPTRPGPDNRMRWGQWPMIVLRAAAEWSGNTGYSELRLMGRTLSAFVDTLSVFLIFLIGRRLYDRRTGLLAAALSALAVMQIQQSHFMTVDQWGVFFSILSLYACVRIAQRPGVRRPAAEGAYQADWAALPWYLLFGLFFGMTLASRINLLPLGGMALVAAFLSVADCKLRSTVDLRRIAAFTAVFLALAFAAALVTFRVTQPMSFRAPSGDTSFFTLHLNQDWSDSMNVATTESRGIGGGPPAEQWTARPAIIFPWVNMVLWGMGLPLGLAAWIAFGWAGWRVLRYGENWRAHLLPLVWTGGYFFFMATRWVKSIRYFLPIYPFLCLLAAWGLLALWQHARQRDAVRGEKQALLQQFLAALLILVVTAGTLAWANAFVSAVYRTDHTRLRASRWIYQNIPGPFHLGFTADDGRIFFEPLGAPDGIQVSDFSPYIMPFEVKTAAHLTTVTLPNVQLVDPGAGLDLTIAADPGGERVLAAAHLAAPPDAQPFTSVQLAGQFPGTRLETAATYYLIVSAPFNQRAMIFHTVIAVESWDEGLPVPLDGRNPFGDLYTGLTIEARWYDDPNKLEMYLSALSQAEYIILPSQRAIWSSCRLPTTFPMTMTYYQALFDGSLGFEQAARFSAPLRFGPLAISDVGGAIGWGGEPDLPIFNNNLLAAEEAFSVYDHPPVWIFRKRPDFSLEKASAILSQVDLNRVEVQSPRDADGPPCQLPDTP